MPQKPPDIPDKVIENKPPDISDEPVDPVVDAKNFLAANPSDVPNTVQKPEDKGWLARTWEAVSKPLTHKPSDIAEELGNWIDQRHLDENPHIAYGKGLLAGGLKGVGDFISGLSSPLNLATTAATMGEGAALKGGMQELGTGLNYVSRALSAPVAAEGAHQVYDAPTIGGKLQGGLQVLLGALGMAHTPHIPTAVEDAHPTGDIFASEHPSEVPASEGHITPDVAESKPPDIPDNVDMHTGEIIEPTPETTPTERVPSTLEIYQNYRKESKAAGTKPLDYNKWEESGRPNAKPTELSAPDPTAGTPSFGSKKPVAIKSGELQPEHVKELASQGYKFSEVAPDGSYVFEPKGEPTVTETAVGENRPTRQSLGPQTDTKKGSLTGDILSLPRSIMASVDMSAPLRQGLPLIHKKQFWQAIPDLFRAFGSEDAFNSIQQTIAEKPLFKRRTMTLNDGTVKELPSFAEDAGIKLTDLHDLSNREEALQSSLAEKIPLFGKVYRASERSYIGFLNKLRADTFESLINNGKVFGADGKANLPLARGLADFVNTATGRGSLGKLESSAQLLGNTFFAPRLIASRLKMLNPHYYITADPMVRKEALKSLFAVAGAGNILGQLAKMAGGSVESDPVSSDFGKIKVGNVRLDPFAGFQQYIVAANRLVQGRTKSSTSGNEYNLGEKFGRQTRFDVAERFAESKLNPILTLGIDILRGKDFQGNPTNIPEAVASRFIPLFLQDLKQLATENPNLLPNVFDIHSGDKRGNPAQDSYDEFHPENLPFAVPNWFGMGVQSYKSKQ
jgi:hypothetical protein